MGSKLMSEKGKGKGKEKKKVNKSNRYILLIYNLKGIDNTTKQSFTHSLFGSGGRKSYLTDVGGYRVGRNAVIVPYSKKAAIIKFMEKWKIHHKELSVVISKKEIRKLK